MHLLTTAADPLAGYDRAKSVLFGSSSGTLLTQGVRGIAGGDLATLAGQVDGPVAGAIGFDGTAHLIQPEAETWSAPIQPGGSPLRSGGWWSRRVPSPAEYAAAVRQVLAELGAGAVDKVVLARTVELRSDEPVNLPGLLRPLLGHGYSFAAPLPGGRTLTGASPELLVSRRGHDVVSNPLAGSAARAGDRAEDRRRAASLTESAKDLHEHRLVVEAVADALAPYCKDLHVPVTPELTSTETMWHLSTRVTGTLRDPGTSALTLAAALHPTPAVCGTPEAEARRMIERLEPFDRGFYAGLVGWTDAAGDGEWAVAIRCAEVAEHTVRLYAGAGIVDGSDPDQELAETSAKFRTMLRALGVSDALV
ncbi:isochorismate synthase [Nonomuraea sp. NPDC050404]|uniref:isochorismate synthase n=1 Tax=Nonomuraea sp. NPDC050404 TaxID=3155783 RepID=UPI0033FA7C77